MRLHLAACLTLCFGAGLGIDTLPAQRNMTVDDVLAVENLSGMAVSPDGRWVAVTVQRGKSAPSYHGHTRLGGDHRSDIWLVSTASGERRRLTDGAADGSGYWAPTWSPDGSRLALLSNQGNENVHVYLWMSGEAMVRRVADVAVHPTASVGVGGDEARGLIWVDNRTVLAVALPADYRPFAYGGDHESQRIATREWQKMTEGKEPSVSVLVSGDGGAAAPPPIGAAALIDVVTSSVTRLAEFRLFGILLPRLLLAPDGKHVALAEPSRPTIPPTHVPFIITAMGPTRLGIAPVGAATAAVRWLDRGDFSDARSAAWSPDGTVLAVVAPRDTSATAAAVQLVDPATGRWRPISPVGWEARQVVWVDREWLLVQVRSTAGPGVSNRFDWWALGVSGETRNLTASMPTPPATLIPAGGAFLAVVAGDLWRVDPRGGATNLTAAFAPTVLSVAPFGGRAATGAPAEVIVSVRESGAGGAYRVTLAGRGAALEPLPLPSPRATVVSSWPGRTVLFRANEPSGTFAWGHNLADGRVTPLAALNQQLAAVRHPVKQLIRYRGTDGDSLHAVLVLPPDYRPGERYPLFTWVYAGSVFRDTSAQSLLLNPYSDISLNLLPLVSRGYAVLFPSMPLGPDGKAGDPMIDLPKGVVAAVDRVVELGIADPERLAVGGQSYGGYSTYSIITYTRRFKAAIALAGPSNLISTYGDFDGRFRYSDAAGDDGTFLARWAEGGQGRMEASPSTNLWRYLRNSPVFFVDRVTTPVLIIQGDIDFVPLTQGEEFFSGLLRQGKTARFLRYWGEGHVLESPANVRHMWNEIFTWLDTHIGPGT